MKDIEVRRRERAKSFVLRNWFWFVLAFLLLFGCYDEAKIHWSNCRGGKVV